MLGYLERTKEKVLELKPKGICALEVFIDASFLAQWNGHASSWFSGALKLEEAKVC